MRLRDVTAPLFVLLALVALTLFALATRYPEAEILARAEGWPVVGRLAAEFRARYLPVEESVEIVEEGTPPVAAGGPEPEVEVIRVVDTDFLGVKPKVWAPRGTPIRERPDAGSRVLVRLERNFPLSRLRQEGDWYEVRFGDSTVGLSRGWVYLENYREPTAEELSAPDPVLPLAAVPISDETLAVAREFLGDDAVAGRCGEYPLWSDVRDPKILAACDRVASGVHEAHRGRYGLEPVSGAAETLFLFDNTAAYFFFRDRLAPGSHEFAHAYPALGYAAVARASRSTEAVASTLAHELGHLINRRALGPALPSWLEEGLARDFSLNGGLGDRQAASERRQRLPTLPGQDPPPRLRELMALDQDEFQKNSRRNYRAAGLWVEYFLDSGDPKLGRGFVGFLNAVAAGRPISEELLLEQLGADWNELEAGFAAWESGGFSAVAAVSEGTTR